MIAPRGEPDPVSYDLGCGLMKETAFGKLVRVYKYEMDHGKWRHIENKPFVRTAAVVTISGRWTFNGPKKLEVDPRVVVLGNAGLEFSCTHGALDEPDTDIIIAYETDELVRALAGTPYEQSSGLIWQRASVPRSRAVDKLSRALLAESLRREPGYEVKLDGLALQLLVELLRFTPLSRRSARGPTGARCRDRVEAARLFMRDHLTEECSLLDLAREAGISPFYFHRLFAAQVGESPHRYLQSLRLEKAKTLLLDTELTGTEICYAVGFGSLPHFINTFRARFGVPPSRFRAGRSAQGEGL